VLARENGHCDTEESRKHAHKKTATPSLAVENPSQPQATEHQQAATDPMEGHRVLVLQLLARIDRLSRRVDEAFSGQPFLLNLPPTAPANRRRFNAFFEQHKKVTKLLFSAIELYLITCGIQVACPRCSARRSGVRTK
jgi:hypothetical protein